MRTGDDLTLECQLRSDLIRRSESHLRTVPEPADAQRRVALADTTQNGVETEGATGVEVGYKVDVVCSRELMGAALEAGPVTVRTTVTTGGWEPPPAARVRAERRSPVRGLIERWRFVCSRRPRRDSDNGGLGRGKAEESFVGGSWWVGEG